MSVPVVTIARKSVDLAWSLIPDTLIYVRYIKITGYAVDPVLGTTSTETDSAEVWAVIAGYSASEIDGNNIKFGDERILIRAKDLEGYITDPAPGDTISLVGVLPPVLREVQAAKLDAARSLWEFQTRRQLSDPSEEPDTQLDWGDLTTHNDSEDWGGSLVLHDSTEDWNATTT